MSDSATLWTIGYQAPLSTGFLRQEYWSGLPFPSPGYIPNYQTHVSCVGRQNLYHSATRGGSKAEKFHKCTRILPRMKVK